MPNLAEGDVHCWIGGTEVSLNETIQRTLETCLSPEELSRSQRLLQAHHRREFLVSHAALRLILSQYGAVSPDRWQFSAEAKGKPVVSAPLTESPLHFNLSHTTGLWALAVSHVGPVGIDVERHDRQCHVMGIAKRFFAPSEYQWIAQLPAAEQTMSFLTCWTLKEAYVKAEGGGLSVPLQQFHFDLSCLTDLTVTAEKVPIAFAPGSADKASYWAIQRLDVGAEHVAAVAVRKPTPETAVHIHMHPAVEVSTLCDQLDVSS